jgi:carbamoyltransferase
MRIVSVSEVHDSSTAIVEDGELLVHTQEERHSRRKHDGEPFWSVIASGKKYKTAEHLCVSGFRKPLIALTKNDFIFLKCFFSEYVAHYFYDHHHLTHAAVAFYNSGFSDAVCIVMDGGGSHSTVTEDNKTIPVRELTTVFAAEYPAKFETIHKIIGTTDPNVLSDVLPTQWVSFGHIFESACKSVGLPWTAAGKLMGMAAYGADDNSLPDVYVDGVYSDAIESLDLSSASFQTQANFAFKVQKQVQEKAIAFVQKAIELSGKKNVCLSGGYALNCAFNYALLAALPDDVQLFVDPVPHDAGISVGAARYLWHAETGDMTRRPLQSLYLGFEPDYTGLPESCADATIDEVAQLIEAGNLVAIFQGKAEAGPRALGNRSILADPRMKNGQEVVNKIKGREWYRPLAGTVLAEHAADWFEMRGLKESPFMCYALNVLGNVREKIPAIVHVDGSCRAQTVTKKQNAAYYDLIKAFYEKTGIPILMNTSFNLAGDPMVETLEDAIDTVNRSKIEYLYLPDVGKLLHAPNQDGETT